MSAPFDPRLPEPPPSTILLVEVGSTAHGTGIPGGEDYDQMGVFVEQPNEVLGLRAPRDTLVHRTQPEGVRSGPGDVDRSLHSLRKFLSLAAAGNPSIIMAFWAPIDYCDPYGQELRDLADAFLGRHIVPRYRGYMQAQAQRLLGTRGGGHGRRGGGGRTELIAAHGYDTKYAMHTARLGFQCLELLTTGRLQFPIPGDTGRWLTAVRRGDIAFDEWWATALRIDARLARLADNDSIRPKPDRARIEAWSVEVHQAVWATLRSDARAS